MRTSLRTFAFLLLVLTGAAGPASGSGGLGHVAVGHVEQEDCGDLAFEHGPHCVQVVPGASLQSAGDDPGLLHDLARKVAWPLDRGRPVVACRSETITPPPRSA